MAETEGQEKTEQPTAKHLKESREKGQVAKSTEINSFAIFTTGLLMIYLTQKFLSNQISDYSANIFKTLNVVTLNKDFFQNFAKEGFIFFIITVAPILSVLFIIALVSGISQAGFEVHMKALKPELSKFNPFKGIKNIFMSSKSAMEVFKSLSKLAIIGGFTYSVLSDLIVQSSNLIVFSVPEIVHFMIEASYKLLWKIALVYAAMAAADYIFQRKKFKKDMMMTKHEVKEENRQTEGDPQIKSRIKRLQFQAAKRRMMQAVPKADVVITNPTHYAIALKYDMGKDAAPRAIAKGVDALAQRIKAIATASGVPLHEDRELARALYKVCDIGDEIPASLFKAVAQILAYVFQMKNYKKKRSIV